MKTDLSRWTISTAQRYSGVYQQQGRLVSDADWNELMEHVKRQVREAVADIVGNGSPQPVLKASGTGAVITPSAVAYVDGLRVVVNADDQALSLDQQPQYPLPAGVKPPLEAEYYLDVWERSVTAVEDSTLLDPALGSADTCTRTQLMAQVKWRPAAPAEGGTELLPRGNVRCIAERVQPVADLGLDTLLRVEVHDVHYDDAGWPDEVTLKWALDNASRHHRVDDSTPATFKALPGVFEFYTTASEQHAGRHPKEVKPLRGVLKPAYEPQHPDTDNSSPLFVRHWDGWCTVKRGTGNQLWTLAFRYDKPFSSDNRAGFQGTAPIPQALETAEGYAKLELRPSGEQVLTVNIAGGALRLQVRIVEPAKPGSALAYFLAGDYWLIELRRSAPEPVRVLNDGLPIGVLHHCMVLGFSEARDPQTNFQPLTQLENLLVHRAGDSMSGKLAIGADKDGRDNDTKVMLDVKGRISAKSLQLRGSEEPKKDWVLTCCDKDGTAVWRESAELAWTLKNGVLSSNPAVVTGPVKIGPSLVVTAERDSFTVDDSSSLYVNGECKITGALTVGGGRITRTQSKFIGGVVFEGDVLFGDNVNVNVNKKLISDTVACNILNFGSNRCFSLMTLPGKMGGYHIQIGGYSDSPNHLLSVKFVGYGGTLVPIEAKNVANTSDANLKRNIEPIVDSLSKVQRLRGVRFQWRNQHDTDADQHLGLLAQEVADVVPEVVKTSSDGHLLLEYSGLIPVLVEAIKEQQQQIQELRARLEKIEPPLKP